MDRLLSLSALQLPQVKEKGKRIKDISGRKCIDLSASVSTLNTALQSCLESKYRARKDVNGSMEYALKWKRWTLDSGRSILALRASARRISDNAYTGWPTPNAMPENRGGLQTNPDKAMERKAQGHQLNLDDAATLAGWVSPSSRDWKDSPGMATTAINPDGSVRDRTDQLPRQAQLTLPLAGWTTPQANEPDSDYARPSRVAKRNRTTRNIWGDRSRGSRVGPLPLPRTVNARERTGRIATR